MRKYIIYVKKEKNKLVLCDLVGPYARPENN